MRALLPFLLTACAAAPARTTSPTDDPRVGVYTSTPRTFATNAYWIEGPGGVVLVDTMFTPSQGVAALEAAEAATDRRVTHAIVLHANPDKFNGTAALQARGVEVWTSAQVAAAIPDVFERRTRAFASRYAPDWPTETPAPESFGDHTTTLTLAGLTLTAHVLGRGVSEAHVVLEWEGHVFAGDLLANGHHGWLEIGATDDWRRRLDDIAAMGPRRLHPGRGPSAGPELLDAQRAYLRNVERIVAAARPRLPILEGVIEALAREVEAAYPDHRHAVFLRIGLPAEYRRQAISAGAARRAPRAARP